MDLERLKEITPEVEKSSNENGLISFTQLYEASSLVTATLVEYHQDRVSDLSEEQVKDFINKVLKVCIAATD